MKWTICYLGFFALNFQPAWLRARSNSTLSIGLIAHSSVVRCEVFFFWKLFWAKSLQCNQPGQVYCQLFPFMGMSDVHIVGIFEVLFEIWLENFDKTILFTEMMSHNWLTWPSLSIYSSLSVMNKWKKFYIPLSFRFTF